MKIYFNISKYPYEGLLSKGIRLSPERLRISSWTGKRCFVSRSEAHKVKENTFYEGDIIELSSIFLIVNITEQSPRSKECRTSFDTVAQFPEIVEIKSQYLFTEHCVSDEPDTISVHSVYQAKESSYISEEVQAYVDKFNINLQKLIASSADAKEKVFWLEQPSLREFDAWIQSKRIDLFHIDAWYDRAGLCVKFYPAEDDKPAQHHVYCEYSERVKAQVTSYRQMTLQECTELSIEPSESRIAIDIECAGSKYVIYAQTYFNDDMDCWEPYTKVLNFEKI